MEIIRTSGDRQQAAPLPEIGGKGLFTAELEQALRAGEIDLAVHSAKDLPTELGEGLDVLAYPVREDPRDAWVTAAGRPFADLPMGSVVGTGSLRRQAQLLMRRPDLRFVSLRGNVDTRIRKVERGDCDGAVLAMAGLKRVGLAERVTHPFEPGFLLPAAGQGALAIEGRRDDGRARRWLAAIHDPETELAVSCERAVLRELDAGCRAPVAVHADLVQGRLRCRVLVCGPAGSPPLDAEAQRPCGEANELVARLIAELRDAGAEAMVAAWRSP